jgi:two-component system chemotaxis response regulator CheB
MIKVLIVDDSAIVRKVLTDALSAEPDIEVVGTAPDPYVARDKILALEPDVVTLDIEMPRMDGLTFLRKMMQHHPLPVIIVSSVTQTGSAASIEALGAGAIDVIAKPGGPHSVGQVAEQLRQRIRGIKPGQPIHFRQASSAPAPVPAAQKLSRARGLILIGASTGGTQAIEAVLTRLPADAPPILIVQHMPAGFTQAFATRLNSVCAMDVIEARGGELLKRGMACIAPGDYHLMVEAVGLELRTVVRTGPAVHYQRPAVDVLFHSATRLKNTPIVAALLTGMGSDGADGMVALRKAGATTIAEDEQSCVVFGMPKEAIARGGAEHISTLLNMPRKISECLDAKQNPPAQARSLRTLAS